MSVILEEEIAATDDAMLSYGLEDSLRRSRQMLADRLVGLRSLSILRADEFDEFGLVVDVRTDNEEGSQPFVSDAGSEPRQLSVTHGMTKASAVIVDRHAGWLEDESEFLSHWRRWDTPTSRQKLLSVYTFDRPAMERRLDDFLGDWFEKESQSMRQDGIGFEIRNAGSGNILVVWNPNSARAADTTLQASSPLAVWELKIWMPTRTVIERSPVVVALTLLLGSVLLATTVLSFVHQIRSRRSEAKRVTFLTRISHDLRTPITNLRLSVDMAEDDLKDDEIAEAQSRLHQMRSDLSLLGGLLDNALDYSRGVRSPGLTETDPRQLIRETVESFRPSYELRGMTLEVEGIENLPTKAKTYPDAVTRIMANLMDNARKYAADGGWVGVEVSSPESAIHIEISDRGPGLEGASFHRTPGESLLTDPSGGGLGLQISKELAEVVGGVLKLVGTEAGTTFQITIPMYPSVSP